MKDGTLGIIGGVGPLASAAFVDSIYHSSHSFNNEQECLSLCMLSDPGFLARTPHNLIYHQYEMLGLMSKNINALIDFGCEKVVVCCYTLHHFIPRLEDCLSSRVLMLTSMALNDVKNSDKEFLLLCSDGSRSVHLYEGNAMWADCKDKVVMPSPSYQVIIQKVINELKLGASPRVAWDAILKMKASVGVAGVIFGCSEFHMVSKWLVDEGIKVDCDIVDPLLYVANNVKELGDL